MSYRPKYRKIWEDSHGPIPLDDLGRPYEIHHKDGNYLNNSLDNLQCVSIQEHYDIHFAQGDFWACQAISFRLNLPEKDRQEMIKLSALQRKGIPRPDMVGDKNPMRNPKIAKKLSLITKNKPKSKQGREGIARAQRERISKKVSCKYCGITLDPLNHARWHGENCKKGKQI